MITTTVIIVAGGTGSRMNTELPKQFLLLKGLPVLMHSVLKFDDGQTEIIIVLHESLHGQWKKLCTQHNFTVKHQLANGGNTRSESVFNGLKTVTDKTSLVAVHDAARPLVSKKLISNLFEVASLKGNAVPLIDVKDSVRMVNANESKAIDRNLLKAVQTPQVFKTSELQTAFESCAQKNIPLNFSDEASLMEFCGHKIFITKGEESNIKITYPQDLALAEALL
ncbi:MAG TPA: 2-C-methyl-D-erythritol 4-phosphate cytidylyltransferase [Bacteroidia bacterium]|nr:2-C-methyl-D-erythritol 4-phosphate cytidylyltransferase [Bacteroidia bacterium]HNU32790.1 2-C-methyl-D-erythritol 4-phosphate cytidylyltransferase [Bacteroidia bacterium]